MLNFRYINYKPNIMYIILGGTGHVGSAVVKELLSKNQEVLIITHSKDRVEEIEAMGAKAAVADVMDIDKLHKIFKQGKRLFLLNPPAPPSTDTAKVERETLNSILSAIPQSGIEKIVAESTYGAQPGDKVGDLGVLYEMEKAINAMPIPCSIQRAAYYYSNWDFSLESAQNEGKIYSFYPPDFKIPMVAPDDLGKFAAHLLMEPIEMTGLYYRTGPKDYSPNDVASAFSKALDKPVEVIEIPESQWEASLMESGFSEPAAKSMANMTRVTLHDLEIIDDPVRGDITLEDYITGLVNRANKK